MAITVRYWDSLDNKERDRIFSRSESDIEEVLSTVETIIEGVRSRGDAACREYTKLYDDIDLTDKALLVPESEFSRGESLLHPSIKLAITKAIENVRSFHSTQINRDMRLCETAQGIFVGERVNPIPSVGLYVPRGRGSLPSMLYMLAVPAVIAGVEEMCIMTPPKKDGSVDPACLYAAELCGVTKVYRIGGAQAIAALAYGTESVPAVAKIVGPGNAYVTAAKRIVGGKVDIGLPAGPSESVIIADEYATAWKVALDLCIEAEHGSESQAILLTPSRSLAETVVSYLPQLIDRLPEPRKQYVSDVLEGYGGIIVTASMTEAIEISNSLAPEHVQIHTQDPFEELPRIVCAGEILLGEHTPFSLANYAAGANAVLPTGGKARTYSGVSVRDFVTYTSVVYATEPGLEAISETVTCLAEYEGFTAHATAIKRRNGE